MGQTTGLLLEKEGTVKKLLVILVALFWAGQLHAGLITVNADDEFTSFTINDVNYLDSIPNRDKWNKIGTLSYDFEPGKAYTLQWGIKNTKALYMGFIGQVDVGNGQIFNSKMFNQNNWSFASDALLSLTEQKTDELFHTHPWRKADTGAISDAYWVGPWGLVEGWRTMTATLSFTTNPAAPVPVPAAAWMLGTGIVALVGFRRKNAAA